MKHFTVLKKSFALAGIALGLSLTSAHAQSPSVAVDLAGTAFGKGLDVHVTSEAQRLIPARSYRFKLLGSVRGTGLLSSVLPAGTKISDLVDLIEDGTGDSLNVVVPNPDGEFPFVFVDRTFAGTIPVTIPPFPTVDLSASVTLRGFVSAKGKVRFDVTGFVLDGLPFPDLGKVEFESDARLVVIASPVVQFAAKSLRITESAGKISLLVRRQVNPIGTVRVRYEARTVTAAEGDFEEVSGEVTFPPGVSERRIRVPIFNNRRTDGSRTFEVTLSDPTAGAILGGKKSVVVTISDDE